MTPDVGPLSSISVATVWQNRWHPPNLPTSDSIRYSCTPSWIYQSLWTEQRDTFRSLCFVAPPPEPSVKIQAAGVVCEQIALSGHFCGVQSSRRSLDHSFSALIETPRLEVVVSTPTSVESTPRINAWVSIEIH